MNSKTIFNNSGESRHPCYVPDFNKKSFSCSPFTIILAIGLSYIATIMLKNIPSIHSFFRAFIMKRCWILSKAFSASMQRIMWFSPCFCLYTVLCLWIYACWAFLASLEWNQLGHDVWSFWHIIGFCLPVFCLEYLHLYSLKILVYNSLFWLFLYWVSEWVQCWLYRMSLVVFLHFLFHGKVWVVLMLILL
jgi:hypothetical protein